jgi:hypothetical protein
VEIVVVILILLLVWFVLAVLFWGGTSWFQGYIYEESTGGLPWRAPAAAAAVTAFLGLWCLLNYLVAKPKQPLPFDVPHSFTAHEEKLDVKELWAKHEKAEARTHYRVTKGTKTETERILIGDGGRTWPKGTRTVEAIYLKEDGRDVKFKADHDAGRYVEEGGGRYMTEDQLGWVFTPARAGSTFLMLVINGLFLAVWFASLWLLLRFQWSHALGIAAVFWLLTTVLIVPQVLDRTPRKAADDKVTRWQGDKVKVHCSPCHLVSLSP